MNKTDQITNNTSKAPSNDIINHLPPRCACRSDKSHNIFTDGEFIFGPYNFDLFANNFYQFDESDDNSSSSKCTKFPYFHDSPACHELSNSTNSVPISACHARHAESTDELPANQSRAEITDAGDRLDCGKSGNGPNDRRVRNVPIELNVIEELDELRDDEVEFRDGKVVKITEDESSGNRESSVDSKTGKIKDIFDDLYFDLYVVEPEIKKGLISIFSFLENVVTFY